MTTQPSILFALRKEFHFDTLEKVLYTNSLRLLKSNLEIKVFQAKEKKVDVSEQEKMIAVLGETITWIEKLYERGQNFTQEYRDQEAHIRDLHQINEVLYSKLEATEKEFNLIKQQQTF